LETIALKRVLIISPYFPPTNAADMQRVRMSLNYFKEFGWEAEVVTVDEKYSDMVTDNLLMDSIPGDIIIHIVKALSKKVTAKLGLGSIALRSLWYYKHKVNSLLKTGAYDLIYFSTTQFPVCILGSYWKKRWQVPYVIDMQDPWHSEYYQSKPKNERPSKYWFSYRLNKYLEPIAMNSVDGLISVSEAYINDLKERYPAITNIPAKTITFGAFAPDLQIAETNAHRFPKLLEADSISLVYIGRGGTDMHKAITPVFAALQKAKINGDETLNNIGCYFIGTSYAPAGTGVATILPLAKKHGVEDQVIELTDRVSFYHALATMQQADALLITGSDDPKYSASKIYPYLLSQKLVLALLNPVSPVRDILNEYGSKFSFSYDDDKVIDNTYDFLSQLAQSGLPQPVYHQSTIDKYSARNMTAAQCALFDLVLQSKTPPVNTIG